jgi:AcrR family transcriptional regulator
LKRGRMETNFYESRRMREKSKLKQAIIETARSIAINEGFEAVTIRRIASAIEYGPPAIYALFENKEAIFQELLHNGYDDLLETLRTAYNQELEPTARLMAITRAYWRFAEYCPRIFNAMHGLPTPGIVSPEPGEAGKPAAMYQIHAIVADILKDILQPRQVSEQELEDMVQILRGTMQGLVTIALAGRLRGGRERALALLERAITDYLTAWRLSKE